MRLLPVLALVGLVTAPAASRADFMSAMSWLRTMQSEMSAWAVSVKQTAVAAAQIGTMQAESAKALATSISALQASAGVISATENFSGRFGQPDSIKCQAQVQGKLVVAAQRQRDLDAHRLMATFAASRVGSQSVADAEALSQHRARYCTVAEAKQGLCALSPNGMQGWDSNYAGAFAERTLAPEGEVAGYAYATMIADTRAAAQADCDSPACAAAQADHLAASALASMAATSLVDQVVERRVPTMTGR